MDRTTADSGAGRGENPDARGERSAESERRPVRPLFRHEALQAYRQGGRPGRPLHIVGSWATWAIRVTILVVLAGLVFAVFAPVGEYAEGIAVVRREGRVVMTSIATGTVQRIEVQPGQRVEIGDVLVRLDDAVQQAELSRARREYQQRLVELLRTPADNTRRERLAALDTRLQLAMARVHERQVVASHAGVISDVRARPGEPIVAGNPLVSIEQEDARTVVVGLFPGHTRPLLNTTETRLFLELEGFPDSRHEVAVRSVGDVVIGPTEAVRYLGQERHGAIDVRGSVVVVEILLTSDRFIADDTEYRIYDGMEGTLEAKLRSATLLETLIPSLRRL